MGFLVAHEFLSLGGERLVYLYDIEVLETHRRSGVGRTLVSELKNLCRTRAVNRIWVGSSVTNLAACALWEVTGATREADLYVEFVYDLARGERNPV